MAESRAVYRAVLRAVHRSITCINGSRQWRDHIAGIFKQQGGSGGSDSAGADAQLQVAKDYAFLLDSVRAQKDLLRSYNLGIRSDVREKDMNAWAASKVGLRMPQVPEE